MKKRKKILPIYFCMIFVLVFNQAIQIYGLNEVTPLPSGSYITIDLDKTNASVGDIIKASVRINQINNFNGYQVNIKYDPSVLQAIHPSTGAALEKKTEPLTGDILVNEEYSPYYFTVDNNTTSGILNFARMYSNLPAYIASGAPESTGTVAVLGFKVISSNVSTTSIKFVDDPTMEDAKSGTALFDWDFNKITDYSVNQAPDINILPAAPTPTVSPKYKISGYITPDFDTATSQSTDIKAGFRVEVVGTGFYSQTNANGYFEIADISYSTQEYSLKISKDSYLYRIVNNVAVVKDVQIASSTAPLEIWAGDMKINGVSDNAINMVDIMEVAKSFNISASDERYSANCDINLDKAINMVDILILAKHFNKTVKDYPVL